MSKLKSKLKAARRAGMTLDEIGTRMNLSPQAVQQIELRALEKMRKLLSRDQDIVEIISSVRVEAPRKEKDGRDAYGQYADSELFNQIVEQVADQLRVDPASMMRRRVGVREGIYEVIRRCVNAGMENSFIADQFGVSGREITKMKYYAFREHKSKVEAA